MQIRVEQSCPQCGGSVELSDSAHLLTCPYCGVRSFLTVNGPFRYVLPANPAICPEPVYAPYIRFRGTIYLVTERGISHKVVDTTQVGCPMPGLPPSLGVRAQAMPIRRLVRDLPGRYLRRTLKAQEILEKAASVSALTVRSGHDLYHRAYIGEALTLIYLPLCRSRGRVLDGITGQDLIAEDALQDYSLHGIRFNPAWQVGFSSSLCPHCGWTLDGEGDCLVLTCSNCHNAWEMTRKGLKRLLWQVAPGSSDTALYLGFWRITGHIPELGMFSFADFMAKTNQPVISKPAWHGRVMQFLVPAFKLRPKIFLMAGRQATIGQWNIRAEEGRVIPNLYPVTLSSSEARQATKVILASAAASPRNIHPYLPRTRLKDVMVSLLYLPFVDRGHDWVQPDIGAVIGKNTLHFGRAI